MIGMRKLLPVIVLLAVHLQDIYGQGYGYNSLNPYNDDEYKPLLYGRQIPMHSQDMDIYEKIFTTRREGPAASVGPDMLALNEYLARTGSLHQLPSLKPTLPTLTRSGKRNAKVQKAMRDMKARLQRIAGGSTRKQSPSKITIDQKFSNSIIESFVYYVKKQMYEALRNWVDSKVTEKETEKETDKETAKEEQ